MKRLFSKFSNSAKSKKIDLQSFIENDKKIQQGAKRVLKIN